MKQLIIFITLFAVLTAANTKSAEIIPVWDKTATNGKIFDIEFMPSGEEFILSSSTGEIQIRSSLDGELIREHIDTTNLFMNGYFEFTPDSNRIVIARSGLLQIVDLETFERLNYFAFGKDSVIKGFGDVVLDPIRPYAYVTLNGHSRETGIVDLRCKIQVYNYETMELVKDLTPYGEYEYTAIEVSHDGRYLATLNDNKAYLKVWDLETMELIINEPLFDVNSDDWCRAEDIYFSELDENIIFISGFFSKQIDNKTKHGIFQYSLNEKRRIRILPDIYYGGYNLIFLNNETKIFNSNGWDISVLSLLENKLEYFAAPPINVYSKNVIYNNKMNYFIGSSGNDLSKFLYDSQSSVNNTIEEEITITPNPTNSIVSINLNCLENQTSYQINNTAGVLIYQNTITIGTESLQIDFTPYPSGVYFLTLNCNNLAKTYKIIKEG
ncbi:MAG: T9SS type A sorting domain-containing protein [Ignavibacteria bacterium]|nr:T9SS type A sorting domain-containing protein [Ignavibacteria bacterium]